MTFEQWRERYIAYFRKQSHGQVQDFCLDDDLKLFFLPEKGFMYYAVRGDIFHIDHTSTMDIAFMHEQARIMAKEAGCSSMETETSRNPAAYARLTHSLLDLSKSGVKADGYFYWCFTEEI